MKPAWIAAFAVAVLFVSGCEDKQARYENQQLRDRLAKLEVTKGGGQDPDIIKYLAARDSTRDGETLDKLSRQLTTLADDVRAGTADLKRQAKQNDEDATERMDDLDKRLKKVDELSITILALKSMIETLERKVEGLDPREVLQLQRDLLTREAELKAARDARTIAEERVATAEEKVTAAEADIAVLEDEISGLTGENITKHPQYKKLKRELRDAHSEVREWKSKYDKLQVDYETLVEQVRKRAGGDNKPPRPSDPNPVEGDYAFTGKVNSVKSGSRPGSPTIVLIDIVDGEIPDKGTELIALDENNVTICRIRVTRLWYKDGDRSRPVELLGGSTIGELPGKPVAKGDKVVWVKPEEPKGDGAGGE